MPAREKRTKRIFVSDIHMGSGRTPGEKKYD